MKDQKVPRELRIDGRLLEKFGYTDECLGCLHRQMKEPGHRPHSSACRRRIYDLMTEDEDELDRINWNDERMGRAAAARDDPSRQPQVPTQKSTQATVDVSVGAEGGRDIPIAEEEEEEEEEEEDIPFGQAAEMPDDDDDLMKEEEDKLPPAVDSDDEDGPAAQYEQESESDDDAEEAGSTAKRTNTGGSEPAAKRARELHALGVVDKHPIGDVQNLRVRPSDVMAPVSQAP